MHDPRRLFDEHRFQRSETMGISRRLFINRTIVSSIAIGMIGGATGTERAAARSAGGYGDPEGLELGTLPGRVFSRRADFNRDGLEHVHCFLVLLSAGVAPIQVDQLVLTHLAGERECLTVTHTGDSLARLNLIRATPAPAAASGSPRRVFAMQLRSTYAQALGIDRLRCELSVREGDGPPRSVTRVILLEPFTQATRLVFPFRGVGMISQGGAANDGHRNRSGMFAIDAMGLSPLYAVMRTDGDGPDALVGWGREVIAPAAGEVVVARGDRPDQPVVGNSDAAYYAAEHPNGGDPGNHLVIDHGAGEFSFLAHLQAGSLAVRAGQRVEPGEMVGRLGNSGDSSAPHLHHQLQTGPDWMTADALPHHYENGPGERHDRGWLFAAT